MLMIVKNITLSFIKNWVISIFMKEFSNFFHKILFFSDRVLILTSHLCKEHAINDHEGTTKFTASSSLGIKQKNAANLVFFG